MKTEEEVRNAFRMLTFMLAETPPNATESDIVLVASIRDAVGWCLGMPPTSPGPDDWLITRTGATEKLLEVIDAGRARN